MTQCPEEWHKDRRNWRVVIHFNLVRAVDTILDAIIQAMSNPTSTATRSESSYDSMMSSSTSFSATTATLATTDHSDFGLSTTTSTSTTSHTEPLRPRPSIQFTQWHSEVKLRLSPLRSVEAELKGLLGAATEELTELPITGDTASLVETPIGQLHTPRQSEEFFVRSNEMWRASVMNEVARPSSPTSSSIQDNAADVIAALRDDIEALWRDSAVQELLSRKRSLLEESAT